MNRAALSLSSAFVVAVAMLSVARTANAQPYNCSGPYNGTCMSADVSYGNVAVSATSTGSAAFSGSDTTYGTGVGGSSNSGNGVSGSSTSGNGMEATSSTGHGIYASSTSNYGIYGASANSYGIYGTSTHEDGIHGYVSNGWSAVAGNNGSSGPGVYGSSVGGDAIYGTATAGGAGVYGICAGSGCAAGYFVGDLDYTGTLIHVSDERLKTNIEPLHGSIEELLRLRGVSFYWKDPSKYGGTTTVQRGFVAQEYEKVFPEWVRTDKDGFKMIDTTDLDALEVESIRTLKTENDLLTDRVKELERGRQFRPAGFDLNGVGFGVGGIAIAVAVFLGLRSKRNEVKA